MTRDMSAPLQSDSDVVFARPNAKAMGRFRSLLHVPLLNDEQRKELKASTPFPIYVSVLTTILPAHPAR